MVEVVDSEEELVARRQQGEGDHDVVLLPSGARQKVVRGPLSGAESTVRYCDQHLIIINYFLTGLASSDSELQTMRPLMSQTMVK